jgi:protein TonB
VKALIPFIAIILFALPANSETPVENPTASGIPADPAIVQPTPLRNHKCTRMSESWMRSTPRNTIAFVRISFEIAADGTTKDAVVVSSSGNSDLDALTLSCIAQWRYEPATKNGQPVDFPWYANLYYGHN